MILWMEYWPAKKHISCSCAAPVVLPLVLVDSEGKNLKPDMYAAGYGDDAEEKSVATFWKNGALQRLSDGKIGAVASSVFVIGTDVYVAGTEYNVEGNGVATFWKNGVPQRLSDGKIGAVASSVFVVGTDVYVAGRVENAMRDGVPTL